MTRKVSAIFYEGTKMVRLSDLPHTQSHLFSGWIQLDSYIKLGEKNEFDCVRYEDYEYWYQNHFLTEKDLDNFL